MKSKSKTWYSPRDINFSREQLVTFLLPNLSELRRGTWPSRESSGYEDANCGSGKNVYQSRAPYENACQVAAEIDARLKLIGPMAELIERLAVEFEEPLQVARHFRMTEECMNREYWRMLNFISGWRRRKCTYQEWKLVKRVLEALHFE